MVGFDQTKVLLTGATGRVGGILRAHWGDRYQLRLADVRPLGAATILASGEPETREMNRTPLQDHEEFVQCDCANYGQMLDACKDMDVVVHLAADPNPGSDWETSLLPRNVVGCYNAFHAAHEAGCYRIVFASSVNAVNGYAAEGWHGAAGVGVDIPVWPVNAYGAAKCFGEALGRVYSTSHNLSAICVRFGSPEFDQDLNGSRECRMYGDPIQDLDEPNVGISSRDTAQLFGCCIDAAKDMRFAIVNGISKHTTSTMDWSAGKVIGYEPQDGTAFAKRKTVGKL